MNSYALYGTSLRSGEPFPELTPAANGLWHFSRGPLAHPSPAIWATIWTRPGGAPWLRVAELDSAWHFAFTDTADFRATAAARSIENLDEDGPNVTVRHLLIDQLMPLLLSLDSVVLHASAIAIEGRAVALIAPGGGGKSTMALQLSRLGCAVLSDDALVVEAAGGLPIALPAYPGLRLWPDSLNDADRAVSHTVAEYSPKKRLVGTLPFQSGPLPLERIYVLNRGMRGPSTFERLPPARLLEVLLSQAFRLDVHGRERSRAHFERLSTLCERVRAWRVRLPDDLATAAAAARDVLTHARAHR